MLTPSPPTTSRPPGSRGTHLVDRAVDYAALRAQGLSPAAIARRRRRSRGYVSIVLRLGEALRGLPAPELAALRHPRITYKLAQRVIRDGVGAAEVHRQLRYALGGFSTLNVDGRSRRGRAATGTRGAAAAPWGWDAAAFAADPTAYVAAHVAALTRLHAGVEAAARRAVAAAHSPGLASAVSLRSLQRLIAQGAAGGAAPPAAREAVHRLRQIGHLLDRASTELGASRRGPVPSSPDDSGLGDALERDLVE